MSLFSFYFYVLFIIVLGASAFLAKYFPTKRMLYDVMLLFSCIIFIAFVSWKCVLVVFIESFVCFFCGKQESKRWHYFGIAVLVGILIFYKFADARNLNILIPIGISFFTFNAISYLSDIFKKEIAGECFFRVLLYLSFFPRFTSGPLQTGKDFFEQLYKRPNITKKNMSEGIQIYCFGLFKKLVLADRLTIFINEVYATPNVFSGASIWLAIFSYSLLIYFDFSGYSDMSIGIGKMLGFDLPANFNMPYLSQNVTEFWHRWHISLSSWIRNYIYIPLGGNRKGCFHQKVNLLIAMTLCGLWHGVAFHFVLWGFFHGIALIVHKKIMQTRRGEKTMIKKIFCILSTFLFTSLMWVLFRAENISQAFLIYKRAFSFADGLNQPYLWSFISISITIMLAIVITFHNKGNAFYPFLNLTKFSHLTIFFIFIGLILALCSTNGSPFIYGAF